MADRNRELVDENYLKAKKKKKKKKKDNLYSILCSIGSH